MFYNQYTSFPQTRMRRNRKAIWSRNLVAENILSPSDLILPIFIQEGQNLKTHIPSLPEVYRLTIDLAIEVAKHSYNIGIPAIILFPYVDPLLKTDEAQEAYNPNNLVCRAIKAIKNSVPEIGIIVDVALDPYTVHGHDGITDSVGYVLNDKTVQALCKQALVFARAGCDIIAPSDMMDGRVGSIRDDLEEQGFCNVQIMSYAAKYASSFYGPFRSAVGSAVEGQIDKRHYHMDCRNSNEAINEVALDVAEGADMVIIKPGLMYLDIIKQIRDNFNIPIIAYQVSGEYSMLKLAASNRILDEKSAFLECLMAFKRAGANAVISYAALKVVEWLNE